MNEKIEIIKGWFEKADHDLGTAKLTYLHIQKYRDTVAFHCQQAVEKYLKAYLIFEGIKFSRTHNLVLLLDLISEKIVISSELYDKVFSLQRFAVEIRYPETKIHLSDEEIKSAISISEYFRQFTLELMDITIDYEG